MTSATPQSGERETTTTAGPPDPLEILVTSDDGVGTEVPVEPSAA